ncbi:MAG: glycoside hydrolase family 127 protein [Promethearchaeota archaeon]
MQPYSTFSLNQIHIDDPFWNPLLRINFDRSLIYQWKQLERVGSIDNFRIVAGDKEGFRHGFFFTDSDAHKWAEAAATSLLTMSKRNNERKEPLSLRLKEYFELLMRAQESDGYLYTYNQFHFPSRRWTNLQVEHELYCMGHLIEAGIMYFKAMSDNIGLEIAQKSADLIVSYFLHKSAIYTPGHQEIEIALLKLYIITKKHEYLEMATQFLEQRGHMKFPGLHLVSQFINEEKYAKKVENSKRKYFSGKNIDIKYEGHSFTETSYDKDPWFLPYRMFASVISGKYAQQRKPLIKMKSPEGHAVRWGYNMVAATMLYQENKNPSLLASLENLWNEMVSKMIYITGGLGALNIIEGFGHNYELPNKSSYCETCAAISSVFWNWELLLSTGKAMYADLLEWQIYNAVNVGIGADGMSYFYRNLLESDGTFNRKGWYETPCCPSNISRVWGRLGQYIYTQTPGNLFVNQYVGNSSTINLQSPNEKEFNVSLTLKSAFPWEGKVSIQIHLDSPKDFSINLRIPGWTDSYNLFVNKEKVHGSMINKRKIITESPKLYSHFNLMKSFYLSYSRLWHEGDLVEIDFEMPLYYQICNPKVKSNRNKVALTRGPLVYCLEEIDNPKIDFQKIKIDISKPIESQMRSDLFNGVRTRTLVGKNQLNSNLNFIPYYLWGNRDSSKMQVWIKKN